MMLFLPALFLACGQPVILLQDKGSDTMVNLMARMSEEYTKVRPDVVVAVTGGGSGTGIKSLVDGTTDMANASRSMKPPEFEVAKERNVAPVETIIAYDGLAIYAHADNPLQSITFEQLKCIYSEDGGCKRWSDLGVKVDCGGSDEILVVGRQNNSGTYEYFREAILGKHGRMTNSMDQSGTQQVVDVVGHSKCAIGYGGMGYQAAGSRFVCLSKKADEPCVSPDIESVKTGKYKFSRPLFVYTNGAPAGETKNFLDWVLSDGGQKVALDAGFVPIR
jgi:phosphate transport system substrate-binding protein